MKAPNQHIESIITRKISGQITAQEQEQLTQWLNENPEHVAYFNSLQTSWEVVTPPAPTKLPSIDINKEWVQFKKSISRTPASPKFAAWQIAASLLMVMATGYLAYYFTSRQQVITIVAQTYGQQVTLPDQSVVTLNKGATLSYPPSFKKESRNVSLTGEAFFEITRNEAKPFTVALSQSSVEVLGTSFNINARKDNNWTDVIVNTGKVKFKSKATQQEIILTRGEKGTLTKENAMLTKTINNNPNYLAWKTRKMVFNNMALDEVIKTINSLYDAQITFGTEVDANCNVTVSFENQSLEEVLSILEYTLELNYATHGNVIEITKTGCNTTKND